MNDPVPAGSLRSDVASVASAPAPPKSRVANEALAARLDRHTTLGSLWKTEGDRIRCFACGHRCLIGEGRRGICKVRFNQGAQLRVPFGYVAALQCDPVEKKPFFHVHPGSDALTFGMMGCDFHCPYCLCGQLAGPRRALGKHLLSGLWRDAHRTLRLSGTRLQDRARRQMSALSDTRSGDLAGRRGG
jgi:hypothetical protein